MAKSTESGIGKVIVKGSIDPCRSASTMVVRGHVPVQRTAERIVPFSTDATMLAGDTSGSRTVNCFTVGQPPTATGPGLLNPKLRDGCINPGSVPTALSRNESSGAQGWTSSQSASSESGDSAMMLSVTHFFGNPEVDDGCPGAGHGCSKCTTTAQVQWRRH